MSANTVGTLQIQGPVVVIPLEEYNRLLVQLKEMTARLEDLEDIRDMQEALQTDEGEAVNYEDYRERFGPTWFPSPGRNPYHVSPSGIASKTTGRSGKGCQPARGR
ncbi:MAG: hypothetical protein E3J21_08305 [Anaerolineales bacterium]|nr:MAG: hypothetical protein E3J21_08305 [Anaerolineales bacterium]